MITSRQHPTYRTRAILRLSVRHFIRASASLLLLLGARRSSAQSPTTLLPDATVLPSRTVRVRALTAWTRFDALLGDGSLRNIAATLATDSLGAQQIPIFTPSEIEIRTASGLANFRLTAGQLVTVANSRVMTAPVILEYGLTRRLTLGIVVPLVESRTTVQAQLNPALGLANVGPNPAFSPSAGASVRTQNAALVTSLRQAADTLRGRVTTCQATPTNPICAPINGQQAAVQTLLQSTTTIAGSLERLYGTSTATPGLPYIPIAKDASQTAINAQNRGAQTAYQMFLAKNVVSGSVVPAAGPAANFQFQSLLTAVGHDTLRSVDRSSIGDISLGATFQVANTFGDTLGDAARTHVRLAVNGTLRIGTGQPGNRNRFFDFGTGYGQQDSRAESRRMCRSTGGCRQPPSGATRCNSAPWMWTAFRILETSRIPSALRLPGRFRPGTCLRCRSFHG